MHHAIERGHPPRRKLVQGIAILIPLFVVWWAQPVEAIVNGELAGD